MEISDIQSLSKAIYIYINIYIYTYIYIYALNFMIKNQKDTLKIINPESNFFLL